MGAAALDALAKVLESPQTAASRSTVLPVELVLRRSCGTGPPPQPAAPKTSPKSARPPKPS